MYGRDSTPQARAGRPAAAWHGPGDRVFWAEVGGGPGGEEAWRCVARGVLPLQLVSAEHSWPGGPAVLCGTWALICLVAWAIHGPHVAWGSWGVRA